MQGGKEVCVCVQPVCEHVLFHTVARMHGSHAWPCVHAASVCVCVCLQRSHATKSVVSGGHILWANSCQFDLISSLFTAEICDRISWGNNFTVFTRCNEDIQSVRCSRWNQRERRKKKTDLVTDTFKRTLYKHLYQISIDSMTCNPVTPNQWLLYYHTGQIARTSSEWFLSSSCVNIFRELQTVL